ncbi:MAG: PilZ domain-containing protein [Pseudomonadota bacterium]
MSANRKIEDLYPRAPRYMIEVGDNEVVRFVAGPRGSKAMHTRIVDISESGMAFLVPFSSSPNEGDEIKMEFNAPNTASIACFAKVQRVQIHKAFSKRGEVQTFKMVAVEYKNLPPEQRKQLADGLNKQFAKKRLHYQREQMWLKAQWFLSDMARRIGSVFKKQNWPTRKK